MQGLLGKSKFAGLFGSFTARHVNDIFIFLLLLLQTFFGYKITSRFMEEKKHTEKNSQFQRSYRLRMTVKKAERKKRNRRFGDKANSSAHFFIDHARATVLNVAQLAFDKFCQRE